MPSQERQVVVRVWLKKGICSVGHTSLQTRGYTGNNATHGIGEQGCIYASIYPIRRNPAFMRSLPFQSKNLEEDQKAYERYRYEEIELNSLDVASIERAYAELVSSGFNFSYRASTFFKNSNTYNCCGLVSYLLYQGGIVRLNRSWFSPVKGGLYGAVIGSFTGGLCHVQKIAALNRQAARSMSDNDKDLTTQVGRGTTLFASFSVTSVLMILRYCDKDDLFLNMLVGGGIGMLTGAFCGMVGITDGVATIPTDVLTIAQTAQEVEKKQDATHLTFP